MYRRNNFYKIARDAYEQIREELKKKKQNSRNDFENGISVFIIERDFSRLFDMNEITFRRNLMPFIIECRKKDTKVRSFIKNISGTDYEYWQWR